MSGSKPGGREPRLEHAAVDFIDWRDGFKEMTGRPQQKVHYSIAVPVESFVAV